MNLTERGKLVKVDPNEVKFASTWLWSSFSNLWRAYKIIVEIHTQQNSPHGFTVYGHILNQEKPDVNKNKAIVNRPWGFLHMKKIKIYVAVYIFTKQLLISFQREKSNEEETYFYDRVKRILR